MISSSFQESAGGLGVIDGSAEIFVAVWVSKTGIYAVVTVGTAIAFIALALDLLDGSDAGRLWSTMAVAHGCTKICVINNAHCVLFAAIG